MSHAAGLFGGGEGLSDERLRALAPRRTDPAGADTEIVVSCHGALTSKVHGSQHSQ
jgi:hypothetical protein